MKSIQAFLAIFIFAVLVVLSSCEKDDNNSNNSFDSSTSCQFIGTIGGTDYNLKEEPNFSGDYYGCVLGSQKNIVPGPDTSIAAYDAGIIHLNNNDGINITIGTAYSTTGAFGETVFYNLFAEKSYPYQPNARDGVEISFGDTNGDFWSTKYGPQTNSTFQFTSITKGYDELFGVTPEVRFEATFKCTLYKDDNSGDKMELTNGKMKGFFQES